MDYVVALPDPKQKTAHKSHEFMNILNELRSRFSVVLKGLVSDPEIYLATILPSQDAKFGDYQANLAMSLGKALGKAPRAIAQQLVSEVHVSDLCDEPEIAGPGFINLRLKNECLARQTLLNAQSARLGVPIVAAPKTFILDYSSPNVAKPMHVGHIRSTVIGDSLKRILTFVGHKVISDNHLGDWGTQFGMIIYGYKHFLNEREYEKNPVAELNRLYRLVRKLTSYFETKAETPKLEEQVRLREAKLSVAEKQSIAAGQEKKHAKELEKLRQQLQEAKEALAAAKTRTSDLESAPEWSKLIQEHARIEAAVLEETAALHANDPTNRELWRKFMPVCLEEIHKIYRRLGVTFDYELGESHYHEMLGPLVEELVSQRIARESEGATCVFLDGFEAPMIIRKRDGAFLYATTDLATIRYRMNEWKPDAILYVVDHRQGEHFDKLFAAARQMGYESLELKHISFGTILGDDGKPFQTRSGDTVGLEGLLDDAIARAAAILANTPTADSVHMEERPAISEAVGIGSIKYADLSQNRTSDYKFILEKMVAMDGATAAYQQYSYVRTNGIFARGEINRSLLYQGHPTVTLDSPFERTLALHLARFSEAIEDSLLDYRPNLLASYLYDLSKSFASFFENCPVLRAETPAIKQSRLILCDLSARTLRMGLELLGIKVPERM